MRPSAKVRSIKGKGDPGPNRGVLLTVARYVERNPFVHGSSGTPKIGDGVVSGTARWPRTTSRWRRTVARPDDWLALAIVRRRLARSPLSGEASTTVARGR